MKVLFSANVLSKTRFKTNILNILFVLYIIVLFNSLINQLFHTTGYLSGNAPWSLVEFLINYQGGFVRRGLLGEILFYFHQHFGLNVEWTVKIMCLVCYILICVFFVVSFLKKGYTLYLIPLCFFCGSMTLISFWIRKDCLMLCFFIAILWIWVRNKKSFPLIVKMVLINLLSILILLMHEVFGFFFLPVFSLLLFNYFKNKGVWKACAFSFISLAPCILTFLFILSKQGSPEIALTIWNSWQSVPDSEVPFNAVQAIGWDTVGTFMYHFKNNFLRSVYGVRSLFYWMIIFPVIYYILINSLAVFRKRPEVYTEKHRTVFSTILLFQFLCLFPLFTVLSTDYARLFFYLTASSFALFLLIPIHILENLFPPVFYKSVKKINKGFDMLLPPSRTIITLLIITIGIPAATYAIEFGYINSVLSRVFLLLTKLLILFRSLIAGIF